jgi:phage shock protein PspC (stress-responsive transcriptional regulator)
MGPASFYWLGFFFKLFGINIAVVRAVLILTSALTIVLLYWLTLRIYNGPFAILPSVFFMISGVPLWPVANHHWDSNFFGLLAAGTFFLWQDYSRKWLLAVAGVLAGITSCFIQQKGLYLILAMAFLAWYCGNRTGQAKLKIVTEEAVLLTGYAGVGCLVLLFFYFSGGLYELIYANVIWPISNYSNINVVPYGFGLMKFYYANFIENFQLILPYPIYHVVSILNLTPLLIIFFMPILLFGFTGLACCQQATRVMIYNSAKGLSYLVLGFALWISELHRKDMIHLIYGSPLLLILLFVTWSYCFSKKKFLQSIGINFIIMCIILFGSYNAFIATSANQKIVSRRGVLYGFKEDNALKYLIEKTNPGDYAFVYPYYPMYYFLADLKNPTRYTLLIGHFNTEIQFNEVIENLKKKHVKYILWDTLVSGENLKKWFPAYENTSKGNLHLEKYIEDSYETVYMENGIKILRRFEDRLSN